MKYFFVLLVWFLLLACQDSAEKIINEKAKQKEIIIQIGSSKDGTLNLLKHLNAIDFSNGMSVGASRGRSEEGGNLPLNKVDNSPLKDWMWSIEKYDYVIETKFENETLVALNFWDYNIIKMTGYHHLLEYNEISKLTLDENSGKYILEVVKIHNKGIGVSKKKEE